MTSLLLADGRFAFARQLAPGTYCLNAETERLRGTVRTSSGETLVFEVPSSGRVDLGTVTLRFR